MSQVPLTRPLPPPPEGFASRMLRAQCSERLFPEQGRNLLKIDRFELLDCLGTGGQGSVFRGYDPDLKRNVAVKRLEELSDRRREQLTREGQTLARVKHPNVVTVHEIGIDPHEGPFIVMALVDGQSLARWAEDNRPSWKVVVRLICQVTSGLAALHREGVVHCDIKPDNILITPDGTAVVVDLGVAAAGAPPTEATETTTNQDLRPQGGTPGYMAPEHMLGLPIDHAADQYSVCVVLHELLHGHRPRRALTSSTSGPAPKLTTADRNKRNRSIPRALDRIVARGLSSSPRDRFGSIEEFQQQLEKLLARRSWWMPALGIGAVAATGAVVWAWPESPTPCAPDPSATESWSAIRKDTVRRAFERTGSTLADASFSRVSGGISTFAAELDQGYAQACGEITDPAHDREQAYTRLLCLASARRLFDETLDQLETTETIDEVTRATEFLGELSLAAQCGSPSTMPAECDANAQVPGYEHEVQQIGLKLQAAQGRIMLGRYEQGIELAKAAIELAQPDALVRLRARGWLVHGQLAYEAEQPAVALDSLAQATSLAERHACDGISAEALSLSAKIRGLSTIGDPEEGLRWSERALDKLERLDDSGPRKADALNSRGIVLHHRFAEYDQADALYQQAIEIREQFLPATALALSDTLLNRGAVLGSLQRHEEAIEALQRALTLRQEALGDDHPSLFKVLTNLGNRHLQLGQADKAQVAFEDALEHARTGYPARHAVMGELHLNLASALEHQRKFGAAMTQVDEALECMTDSVPSDSLEWGRVWNAKAQLLLASEESDEALVWMAKHAAQLESHPQATALDRAELAYRRAEIQRALQQPQLALRLYEQALAELSAASVDADSVELISHTTLGKAEALLDIRQFEEAERYARIALDQWSTRGSNPEQLAYARFAVARALLGDRLTARPGGEVDQQTRQVVAYFAEAENGAPWHTYIETWRNERGLN